MKTAFMIVTALWVAYTTPTAWRPPAIRDQFAHRAVWIVGQEVNTTSGPVRGHAAANRTEVSEYLGIPYAQPPVGDLRFKAPAKYQYNSSQAISGSSFGPSCMSTNVTGGGIDPQAYKDLGVTDVARYILTGIGGVDTTSEDCLTLNIWTKPQVGEEKKAVLFWIHGGAFISGGSSIPWYNGQYIADQQDVILVSINYRLSIFGFPGNPLSAANLGLLDQRLALEWVRDNIAAFGGDPARITLFGQSAGGAAVDYHSYAYARDPIAHGYIPMSGTATGFGQLAASRASEFWYNATEAVGCGRADGTSADRTTPEEVFACMMEKPAQEIANSVPVNTVGGSTSDGLPFGPTVDDKVVFASYQDRAPAKAPVLVGNTDFEAGLFRLLAPTVQEQVWSVVNQVAFVCPAALRAAVSVLNGNPTWRYRWFGEFPNLILTTTPSSGAWHASDVPVLFNNTPTEILPDTSEELAIGDYIRGAWAAFAKNPATGLDSYGGGWPRYSSTTATLIRLAFNNKTGTNVGLAGSHDLLCRDIPVVTSPPPNSTSPTTTTPSPTPKPTSSAIPAFQVASAFMWTAAMCVGIFLI